MAGPFHVFDLDVEELSLEWPGVRRRPAVEH
jgi:hypothetical protein